MSATKYSKAYLKSLSQYKIQNDRYEALKEKDRQTYHQRVDMLLCGFYRNTNILSITNYLPPFIPTLCYSYYPFLHTGNHNWLIDEATLPQFKAAKPGKQFKSPEFEIGPNLRWHLECYPNGKFESDTGYCQLYLVASSFPEHITNIIIYYELHCVPTISNFSGIKSFTKPDRSVGWFRGVLRHEDLKILPSTHRTLPFECTINILRIESKDGIIFQYPLEIDFQKQSEFVIDWQIKDDMLTQFRTAKHGKFLCSNVYNGLWCLQCAPNGYRNNDHGSVRLFMQLCALPKGIKSLHLTRKVECIEQHIEKETTKDLPWGYTKDDGKGNKMRQNSGWGRSALPRTDVLHLDEINFRVTINILGYTTIDGKTLNVIFTNDGTVKPIV